MRIRIYILSLLTLVLVAPPFTAAQEPEGTLALETYLDWETVRSPQVSPDGDQVLFTRGWVDKINDRRRSSIWIMNADGSRSRLLIEGSSPIWSPDGTRVAFIDEGQPDGRQIFVRWMGAPFDSGRQRRVTNREPRSGLDRCGAHGSSRNQGLGASAGRPFRQRAAA